MPFGFIPDSAFGFAGIPTLRDSPPDCSTKLGQGHLSHRQKSHAVVKVRPARPVFSGASARTALNLRPASDDNQLNGGSRSKRRGAAARCCINIDGEDAHGPGEHSDQRNQSLTSCANGWSWRHSNCHAPTARLTIKTLMLSKALRKNRPRKKTEP
jgi:hypothetical protein